jgi:hypothetical protein
MSAYFDEINVVSGTLYVGSGTDPNYDIILSDTSGVPTVFNNNNQNIDFVVEGQSTDKVLYFDASTGRLGLGLDDPDSALHILASCANEGLKIENVTNCPTGVRVLLIHNTQTLPEVGGYPATIDLAGRDLNYNQIIYGQIRSRILNATTSQTSGEMIFTVDHTGVNQTVFRSSVVDTVLGGLNIANGHKYNVVGYNNNLSGVSYVNVGSKNQLVTTTGIVIGNDVYGSGEKILIISNNSDIEGNLNLAFTTDSNISGISNIVIGHNVISSGSSNVLIGSNNTVVGSAVVGLLNETSIMGSSGIGFGSRNDIVGDNNIYLGNDISITGYRDVAVGSDISVTGWNNIVYGSYSDVGGYDIVSIGTDNNPQNIASGIYIGSNINLANSKRSVIIGLGNQTSNGLDESIVLGINNTTNNESPTGLLVIGQANKVAIIKDSLIVGNDNNLSGLAANNVIVGPKNATPSTSINNTIIGALNNVSGARVYSDGSIVGAPLRVDGSMTNTNIFGINNAASHASGAVIIGNRSLVSGVGNNTVGSFNNLRGANYLQNIGNSNVVVGSHNNTIGNKIDLIGSNSIVVATDPFGRTQVFGSGNIVLGANEVVTSGLAVGQDNEIHGPLNVIYGSNNTLGIIRHPCIINDTNVIIQGNVDSYTGGDKLLINVYAPGSKSVSSYIRNILDGEENGSPLGIIKNNEGLNFTTTLVINNGLDIADTVPYSTVQAFDQDYGTSPVISGYVMLLQRASQNQDDTVLSPLCGFQSVVIGSYNRYAHSSGIILGSNNRVSGVKHIVIGHGISGYYNDAVQIGSNNTNKMILDDRMIVFNTGEFQNSVYFNSSNGDIVGNSVRAMKIDLSTNRIGVNNDNPRSNLDVSGTITTQSVRVGLSATSGHVLTANSQGVGNWELPVNLSGTNSGLLFKTSDKVGSGLKELVFNTTTKELYYLRGDRESGGSISLDDPTSIEERVVIFTPTGLFINEVSNDYAYDFVVKGSGFRDDVDGDLSVYLLRTRIPENAIQVYNISGVSGYMADMHINNSIRLPASLTGTLLYSDQQGRLLSKSFAPYSVLYTNRNYVSTGVNSFRYYPNEQAITIGMTGTPPAGADTSLITGPSNTFSNIVLSSNTGNRSNFAGATIFNNAGLTNQFIVVDINESINKKGLIYDTAGTPLPANQNTPGSLGIGVSNQENWNVSLTDGIRPWYEAGKLVVNGKIRARSLQLSDNSPTTLPGAANANKYLKILDANGNVGLGNVLDDFNFQFTGIHPLSVTLNQGDDRVDLRLATVDKNGFPLTSSSNGLLLTYNGNSWEHGIGFRTYQPESSSSNVDAIPGVTVGGDLALNSCYNNHVFGAGSFVRNNVNFAGSSQYSRFYLRGRTLSDNNTELLSNWHKDVTTEATANNSISIQYLPNGVIQSMDHRQSFVWNYTIDFAGIFSNENSDLSARQYEGCAGKIEGSIISYINANGARYTSKMGSDNITFRTSSSNVSYSELAPPMQVIIKNTFNDANKQRLAIVANGKVGYNAMWSVTTHIQQVMMPSGVLFGGTTIVAG